MKRCSSCALSKTAVHFGKQKDGNKFRLRSICKDCHNQQSKNIYKQETEKQKLIRKNTTMKRLYGITLDEYNQMFSNQNGVCSGCNKHQSELPKSLAVDHCHFTNKVRGLLCAGCNLALGNVKEDPKTLHRLANYIQSKDS